MKLSGSKTEKNLLAAFMGESAARNKYTFFASAAKKEGLEQIAAIFLETADNEKEHAKLWLRALNGFSSGTPGATKENLLRAAEGEHEEWTNMYREFAEAAREEGFDDLAVAFTEVAEVEEEHEKRYRKLIENLENNTVFHRDEPTTRWRCRNCGYVHEGTDAPDLCPACQHPKAYYELDAENY